MESLQFALFLVMLELAVGSFVCLFLLDLRADSSRGFIVFQGWLYLVFGVLALLAMNAHATPEVVHGRGLDEAWVRAQGPLVVAFTLLMIPWNVLLWRDKNSSFRFGKKGTPVPETTTLQRLRYARYGVGGLTTGVGVVALFVVGMAYRTLADSRLGGAFVVLAFLAGAVALGGVMTAMLLGHWYLNTPTATGRPLEFMTLLTLGGIAAALLFGLLNLGARPLHPVAQGTTLPPGTIIKTGQSGITVITPAPSKGQSGSTTAPQQSIQPVMDTTAMAWMEFVLGFVAPLGLGAVAYYLTRGRSFQSATGMLYLCVAFVFLGEILARGLLVFPISSY
jgi:hypothetical protein